MERNLSGGRYLAVIGNCHEIDGYQKAVLHYLAAQLNFNGNFDEWRWYPVRTISQATGWSDRQVQRALKQLVAGGFLLCRRRFKNNGQLPSEYLLTDKIFLPPPGDQQSPPLVTSSHHPGDQQSPPLVTSSHPELLQEEAPSLAPSILTAAKAAEKIHTKNPFAQKRQEREACEIISAVVAHDGFVNVKALDGAAKGFLERYGIETLRAFRAHAIETGRLGAIKWDANKFSGWLEDYYYQRESL
jgi:hypothetical protein